MNPLDDFIRLMNLAPPNKRYLLICHGISDEENELGLLGILPDGWVAYWRPEVPSGQVLRVEQPPSFFQYQPPTHLYKN